MMKDFLKGIEVMNSFIEGFNAQIANLKNDIDHISVQVDNLAEVSLGRGNDKLAIALRKYNDDQSK